MKSSKYILLAIFCVVVGCNEEPHANSVPAKQNALTPTDRSATTENAQVHDFGIVLGNNKILSHVYKIINKSGRTLRLIEARAMTPCCSSIGPILGGPIEPGGVAAVPVSFKTGSESGKRRLEFFVKTDSPTTPTIPLVLTATCYDEWEIIPAEGMARFSLKPGRTGKRVYRILSRCLNAKDSSSRVVSSDPSLSALFEPGETETILPPGVVEVARQLVVTVPATSEPGLTRAKVVLGVGETHTRTFDVEWYVTPCLTVSPSGLVIERGDGTATRSIVILSGERPFRIVRLSGPHLIGPFAPTPEAKTNHRIDLQFDTSDSLDREAFDVRVDTDHPDQPVVKLGVLMLKKTMSGDGR